ncbi:hypothetical protein BDV28DRAFT_131068 [Aspergillus coremiiformis]|uniref:EF-hand domain-containing protein n=1 Tax=Aspergillus coremiiformis TaxID=138285 RepID=A0A5N6ZCD1_9EURO|nr:hypothetical protein BDV28DRAFT_131068 [Aspergillus coremiiformis]
MKIRETPEGIFVEYYPETVNILSYQFEKLDTDNDGLIDLRTLKKYFDKDLPKGFDEKFPGNPDKEVHFGDFLTAFAYVHHAVWRSLMLE